MSAVENNDPLAIDHLSDEHYRLIGRAVVAWAHVEEAVASLLTKSLMIDARQGLAIKQTIKNYNSFVSQVSAIWKATNEDIFTAKLKPILEESKDIYLVRNKFSHRPWYSDGPDSIYSFDGKYTNHPFSKPDFLNIDELKKIPSRCDDVINKINLFWIENRGQLASLRDMHGQ